MFPTAHWVIHVDPPMAWHPPLPPRGRSMDQASLMALKRLFPKKTFQDLLELSQDVPGRDVLWRQPLSTCAYIYIYTYNYIMMWNHNPFCTFDICWLLTYVDICRHMYISTEAIVLYQVIFAHVTVECITTLLIYNDCSYWDLCFCWSIMYRFSHCWSNINLNLVNVYIYILNSYLYK